MKRTRWIILCLVLANVMLGSLKGAAQAQKTKGECAQLTVQAWSKDVATLNNAQKSGILNLTLSFYNKLDSINGLDTLTFEVRQQQKKDAHALYLDSINGLLTVAQRKDVDTNRTARNAAMGTNSEKK
jgi:hypothetical protein